MARNVPQPPKTRTVMLLVTGFASGIEMELTDEELNRLRIKHRARVDEVWIYNPEERDDADILQISVLAITVIRVVSADFVKKRNEQIAEQRRQQKFGI